MLRQRCPRCGGNLFAERTYEAPEVDFRCLQCGRGFNTAPVPGAPLTVARVAGPERQPAVRAA